MMCTSTQVDCKPFRASYDGRWDAMVSKTAKCVLRLLEIAKGRKRNFILDQVSNTPILYNIHTLAATLNSGTIEIVRLLPPRLFGRNPFICLSITITFLTETISICMPFYLAS